MTSPRVFSTSSRCFGCRLWRLDWWSRVITAARLERWLSTSLDKFCESDELSRIWFSLSPKAFNSVSDSATLGHVAVSSDACLGRFCGLLTKCALKKRGNPASPSRECGPWYSQYSKNLSLPQSILSIMWAASRASPQRHCQDVMVLLPPVVAEAFVALVPSVSLSEHQFTRARHKSRNRSNRR